MTAPLLSVEADRGPVANVEAEAALLGALMSQAKLIDPCADLVATDDFHEPLHARIFAAILSQHGQGKLANPVTLRPLFADDPAMAEVGGPAYLARLSGSGAAVIGAVDFAKQIRELAQRRRFVELANSAIEEAENCATDLTSLLVKLDDAAAVIRDGGDDAGEHSAADALQGLIDGFDRHVTGTMCGVIPSIDQLLGPMRPTHFIIGAGRPGMGKTATAISYALGAAAKGHGVLFISLEMAAEQLAERMAADLCLAERIPYEAIRDRTLTNEQKRSICRAHAGIAALPLQILDKSGLTIGQVRTVVRRWKRRFEARGKRLELVILDYLQLVRPDRKALGPYEAVSEVSRTLKEIAKESDVAVFALAQLSRKVEERGDKRPILADLRDSGQIEQDADAVLFFLRPEYYLRQAEPLEDAKRPAWEQALTQCEGAIEFICAKRRNGRSGMRVGHFHGEYQAVRG